MAVHSEPHSPPAAETEEPAHPVVDEPSLLEARLYPWRANLFHDHYSLCAGLSYEGVVRLTRQYAAPAPAPPPRQFKSTMRAKQLTGASYDSGPSWTWLQKQGHVSATPPTELKGGGGKQLNKVPLHPTYSTTRATRHPSSTPFIPPGLSPQRQPSFYYSTPSTTLSQPSHHSNVVLQPQNISSYVPLSIQNLPSASSANMTSSIDARSKKLSSQQPDTPLVKGPGAAKRLVTPATLPSAPTSLRHRPKRARIATYKALESEAESSNIEASSVFSTPELNMEEIEESGWTPRSELVLSSHKAARDAGYGWRILSTRQTDLGWTLGCSTTGICALRDARCPARMDIKPYGRNSSARLWRVTKHESTHNHGTNPNEVLNDWKSEEEMLEEYNRLVKLRSEGHETAQEWRGFTSSRQHSNSTPLPRQRPSASSKSTSRVQQIYSKSLSHNSLSIEDLRCIFASLNLALADFATPLFNIGLDSYEAFITFIQSPLDILDGEDIGNYVLRRVMAKELTKVRKDLGLEKLDSIDATRVVL